MILTLKFALVLGIILLLQQSSSESKKESPATHSLGVFRFDGIPEEYCNNGVNLDSYDFECIISSGRFGATFKVSKNSDPDKGCTFAVKAQRKPNETETFEIDLIDNELKIMTFVRHPFILHTDCMFQDSKHVYIINDLMTPMSWLLEAKPDFNENTIKFYLAELIVAVQELHAKDVAHLNVVPKNILLDNEGHIVLMDFGYLFHKGAERIYKNAPRWYHYRNFKYFDALNVDFAAIGNVLKAMLIGYEDVENFGPQFEEYRTKMQEKNGQIFSKPSQLHPERDNFQHLTDVIGERNIYFRKEEQNHFGDKYIDNGSLLHLIKGRQTSNKNYPLTEEMKSILGLFWKHQNDSLDTTINCACNIKRYFKLLKKERFFANINWKEVYKRQLTPPLTIGDIKTTIIGSNTKYHTDEIIGNKERKSVQNILNHIFGKQSSEVELEVCDYVHHDFGPGC